MVDGLKQSRVPTTAARPLPIESLTFTLPKEVSLFAEGDPEEAKAAM
jgi:hypothetical protein